MGLQRGAWCACWTRLTALTHVRVCLRGVRVQGLKMYPNDVKGLFRRATVYERQVRAWVLAVLASVLCQPSSRVCARDSWLPTVRPQVVDQMSKEDRKEFWDPERVKALIDDALADVTHALSCAPAPDAALLALKGKLEKLEVRRAALEARKEKQLRAELAGKFFTSSSGSAAAATSTTVSAATPADDVTFDDMPPLDD